MSSPLPDLLAGIVAETRAEVARRREVVPLEELRREAVSRSPAIDVVPHLAGAIAAHPGRPAVIAEFKRASPSAGLLRADPDPVDVARAYIAGGAAMLSILTEPSHFRGSLDDLRRVRAALPGIPLLRKDFVVDPYQVWESRAAGADALLLIVACLDDTTLVELFAEATAHGMTPLVEVHTPAEATRALAVPGLRLLGINNRDLATLRVRPETTRAVLDALPDEARSRLFVVSESGLSSAADVADVAEAGARAILVGEALLRQADPGGALSALFASSRFAVEARRTP